MFSVGVFAKQDLHLVGNIDGFLRASGEKNRSSPAPRARSLRRAISPSRNSTASLFLPFYDKYLKGADDELGRAAEGLVSGSQHGQSARLRELAPSGTRKARFFLAKGPTGTVTSLNDGALVSSPASADGGATSYSYPHPSWVFGNVPVGPAGPDPAAGTLTFTSAALERDLNSPDTAR